MMQNQFPVLGFIAAGVGAIILLFILLDRDVRRRRHAGEHINYVMPSATALGVVIIGVLLLTFAFLVALFPNILGNLNPTCSGLQNLRYLPLPINVLGIVAGIGISWALARLQRDTFRINSVGTKMLGRSSNSKGYISTKWLVIFDIPLVPVCSYQVLGDRAEANESKSYVMEPLKRLDWSQIQETARQAKVAYLIMALGLAGITILSATTCS